METTKSSDRVMISASPYFRGLLFSYNRAMQLDATLRSLMLHCSDDQDLELSVLYKASGEQHQKQYLSLIHQYQGKNIRFLSETHFRQDVLHQLLPDEEHKTRKGWFRILAQLPPLLSRLLLSLYQPAIQGFIFFLVDDAIFIRDFRLSAIQNALIQHPDALGFSLRLGKNTTYCYTKDVPQKLPDFSHHPEDILKYRWTDAQADFKYPLEISSSIYRLQDIWRLLPALSFHNPNLLEGRMASRASDFADEKPCLLCFERSVAFCTPVNKIQNQADNRSGGKDEYTIEALARKFDQGFRIDVQSLSDFTPISSHQEIDLEFVKIRD